VTVHGVTGAENPPGGVPGGVRLVCQVVTFSTSIATSGSPIISRIFGSTASALVSGSPSAMS
jgi:hypothetical protein